MKRRDLDCLILRVAYDRGNPDTFVVYAESVAGDEEALAMGEVGPFDSWVDLVRPLTRAIVDSVRMLK